MNVQLLEGERIRLARLDPEKDAEALSAWTHGPEYLRLTDAAPTCPLSPGQIKNKLEEVMSDNSRHPPSVTRHINGETENEHTCK